MVENRSWVLREGVYRWFSTLTSARRTEFLCGLLDLCVPIELRFLGSCLEDLARKDYNSLRDAEIKANNPADLSSLTNITDEVVRSKLLVSLALLSSDNREAAGVLYRTLTHIDTVINNYGLPLNDGQTEEQFLLLFTMASNHPAFSFHQKQLLRQELRQIQDILQVGRGNGSPSTGDAQCPGTPFPDGGAVCHGQSPLHHHLPPMPHNRLHQTAPAPLDPLSLAPHRYPGDRSDPTTYPPACHTLCSCWHKKQTPKMSSTSGPSVSGQGDRETGKVLTPPTQPPPASPPPPSEPSLDGAAAQGTAGRAVIERVEVRSLPRTADDPEEYTFEAHWLDGCVSSVVRSQQEVTELLSQLADAFPEEALDKLANTPLELDPRCLTALSGHVLQHRSVHLFLTPSAPLSPTPPPSLSSSSSPPSLPPSPPSPPPAAAPGAPVALPPSALTCSTKLGSLLQYRGANRPPHGVASVQPAMALHSSFMTRSLPQLCALPPSTPLSIPFGPHSPQKLPVLPPALQCPSSSSSSSTSSSLPASFASHAVDSIASRASHSYGHAPQGHPPHGPTPGAQYLAHSLSHCQPGSPLPHPAVTQAPAQAQVPALAPVHPSQGLVAAIAPPEPNGILDWLRRLRLHKYYPVFKQLSMDEFLALTEEDLNKYDLTQGAKKKLKTQLELQNREMKLEKRYASPQFPGSCGGVAMVTPSSHMRPSLHPTSSGELRVEAEAGAHHHQGVPVPRESSSSSGYPSSLGSPRSPLRRSTAFDRTKELHRPLGGGPEKDRACVLLLGSSSGRPTAQVLPVQTDPPPPPLQAPLPPSANATASSTPSSSCHPVFSLGPLHPHHPGYPGKLLASAPHPPLILASPRKLRPLPMGPDDRAKGPLGAAVGPAMGLRLDGLFPAGRAPDGLQDPATCRGLMGGGAVGLMVDTSSALASTSDSLHHVSHPPVHFHLSSAPAPSAYYSYPAGASSFSSVFSSSSVFSTSCFVPYSSSSSSSLSSKPGPLTANAGAGGGGAGFVPMATGNNTMPTLGSYCSPPVLISSPSPSPPSSSSSSSSSSCSSLLDCSGGANSAGYAPPPCPCSSCGCHGSCGAFGALPGYATAGYLRPFAAAAAGGGGPSLFTLGPVLHFSPLIASSASTSASSSGGGGVGGPFSYPLVAPQALYRHGVMSHDLHQHQHQQQQGCGAYTQLEMPRNAGAKRAVVNVSCYNCGVGGHRAEDCKQPPMDAQQGTFRLKYLPRPDTQDSGE